MSSQVTTPAEPTTLSFQAQVRLHFRVCFVPTKSHSPLPFLHRRAGTRRQYTRPALHRIASPHFTSTTTGQAALRAAMAAGSSSSWGPSPAVVKVLVALLGLGLAGYIVGPPLYWHVAEALGGSPGACPACDCDCDALPLLSLPEDCAKQFKEVNNRVSGEETEKSFTELLIEELKQREEEATQAQQQADVKLLEAKKLASQYQKEADKCSSGMDTCEEAREKSVQALLDQKKLTALWEERAQGLGWKSGNIKPHQD